MRKLALTLLLGASLPAFAANQSINSNDASSIKKETVSCESATCKEAAEATIVALLNDGGTPEQALAKAKELGLNGAAAVAAVTAAAVSTGKATLVAVMQAAQKADIGDLDIIQGLTIAKVADTAIKKAAATIKIDTAIVDAGITAGKLGATAAGDTGSSNSNNESETVVTPTVVVNDDISPG